ncbi:ABC transporter substrate-binding protein [Variovorax paradoxus]|uniref:ABC transporter substrate-binding protein n=1 Tax=Variovorax paradoxus TaxID=34073 RepID=UPI00278458D3|nr:ABC transporter substrate-binding protein [Variovorax paradoxus]MDP9932796.1 branched-chain amino acid transport system substrate-binding protein [Variovorax paradoxus]
MTRTMIRIAALCTFTLLGCAAAAQTRVGFIGTFSGPGAALGQDQFDGFMLAVEQKGGKLGGSPVNVIKEDDQLKPELGVQLVQKLVEKEKVDLITGITFSNVMMATAKPLAAGNQIFVGSNAGPAALAGSQCNANFFFTSWQNDALAEVLGKYANEKGYRKVVMLAPNYQAGKDSITGFKRYFKGTVVGEIYTQLNQPDYAAELAQVEALAPDAVYAFFPGGMGINFIKQMKQAGLLSKIPLLTVAAADGTTLPALKESAEGVLMGAHWGPDFTNPANKAFVAAFEAKYKRIPSQYAAQSFDAAMLIDSALSKTGGSAANKAALRDALRQAKFESVRGPFSFSKNGFPVQDMYVFQVAKDDKGRTSLKTIASPLKAHADAYVAECPLR